MSLADTAITIIILALLLLIIWSRVMKQTMYDTIMEIRDIFLGFVEVDNKI